MMPIYGISGFGAYFLPTLFGFVTVFIVWLFSTREHTQVRRTSTKDNGSKLAVLKTEVTHSGDMFKDKEIVSVIEDTVSKMEPVNAPTEDTASTIDTTANSTAVDANEVPRVKRTFNRKKACAGKDGQRCSDCKKGKKEIVPNELNEDAKSSSEDSGTEMLGDGVLDMEELGSVLAALRAGEPILNKDGKSEMLTPMLRERLAKQGLELVGSHSGVKLCRWTKSMLRGHGGCYKHSFYGIDSHRCMETTPSLACANKCIFCWRHPSNPVGTEWLWKTDTPEDIFVGTLNHHYNMINQLKGASGVLEERILEGMDVKHCALSLIGEPIMYPEISTYVKLLHSKGISSFLVTNAQFPEAIRNLSPVTQLHVSIDASTKETLKKIDRPLFKDFWERFNDSLTALSEKGQRTVYRLTLIKKWNIEEIESYASLVERGKPDFLEIKSVIYCATTKDNKISSQNVPQNEEVLAFAQRLADCLPNYEIASEHEHSNCVLLANSKFKVDGEWWTWIDFDKFHNLVEKYYETDGKSCFSAEDYMRKTPHWASYGCSERGFDPDETRKLRNRITTA